MHQKNTLRKDGKRQASSQSLLRHHAVGYRLRATRTCFTSHRDAARVGMEKVGSDPPRCPPGDPSKIEVKGEYAYGRGSWPAELTIKFRAILCHHLANRPTDKLNNLTGKLEEIPPFRSPHDPQGGVFITWDLYEQPGWLTISRSSNVNFNDTKGYVINSTSGRLHVFVCPLAKPSNSSAAE